MRLGTTVPISPSSTIEPRRCVRQFDSFAGAPIRNQLARLSTQLLERAPLQRLRELRSSMTDKERDALLAQTTDLQKALTVVARELRK